MMTEYCVLQNPNIILSFESDKMLSKFWPKLTFVQHLQQFKRLTEFRILIIFWLLKNVNIISTNVTIILAFCSTQRGVMLPVWGSDNVLSASLKALYYLRWPRVFSGDQSTKIFNSSSCVGISIVISFPSFIYSMHLKAFWIRSCPKSLPNCAHSTSFKKPLGQAAGIRR